MRLIDQGKKYLDAHEIERAEAAFRDAANIDISNGAAFYYLAMVKVREGDQQAADGLLDKASTLLGDDPAWQTKIEDLRAEMGKLKPNSDF